MLILQLNQSKPEFLRQAIPWLLIAIALYLLFQPKLGERDLHPRLESGPFHLGLGLLLGFYDGFFGPGTGSFLIFIFIGWFGFDFLSASASAKVINFATNLSAVLYFGFTDNILYRYALPMAVCNIAGSLTGTRLAMAKGNKFVRGFFLCVVTAMIARFGWDLFFGKGT